MENPGPLTLDPKDLLLALLSQQRAHRLHHLPNPVVFNPQYSVSSSVHFLLSPHRSWLGQVTVISHLGPHYRACHHSLYFHAVLLPGLPLSTLSISPWPAPEPSCYTASLLSPQRVLLSLTCYLPGRVSLQLPHPAGLDERSNDINHSVL